LRPSGSTGLSTFQYSFNGYELVQTHVDAIPPPTEDFMLWTIQSAALLAFGIEIVALVSNLAVRWPS
jgi:hypothetical protein